MITIAAGLAAMTPLLSTSGIRARIVAVAVISMGRTPHQHGARLQLAAMGRQLQTES
jgi:hypothetical protein